MKNPNVLKGHEGELIQTTQSIFDVKQIKIDSNGEMLEVIKFSDFTPGVVVLFLEVSPNNSNREYIRFLREDRIYQFETPLNSWMRFFIPWPRGGFVGK